MEKKDYISKLFLNNQDKLEQQPSEGLWDRIESNLDESMPLKKSNWSLIGLYRMSAAAAVIGLTVGIFLIHNSITDQPIMNMVLDEALAQVSNEAEPYEDEEVLPKSMAELDEKLAISKQEKKIIEAVRTEILRSDTKNTTEKEKIEFQDIELNDNFNEIPDESIIMIEPEPSLDQAIEEDEIADFYQNNEKIQSEKLNYAISSPQLNSRSTIPNLESAQQDKNYENKVSSAIIGNKNGMDTKQLSSNSSIVYSKDTRRKGLQKNNFNIHPKLRAFEFIVGAWIDKHEYDGQSFESWKLINRNKISGIGTKKSNEGDILFEETFFLEIKHNKVFLTLTFAENGNKIEYMLSKSSNERFVFIQKGKPGYPDKVILQKMMDGYTVIINNSLDAMSIDQQRFLENRNRVTSNASKRILSKNTSVN